MSRYIDADAVYRHLRSGCAYVIWEEPTIDIVFCKECKYSSDDGTYGCMADHFNGLDDVYHRMYADDFCSYGEREGE